MSIWIVWTAGIVSTVSTLVIVAVCAVAARRDPYKGGYIDRYNDIDEGNQ